MTQRERVLQMLKDAGPQGIRSDECIKDFMPRAAARVQELKEEGYEISSEREGKYSRWTLTNVGSNTESRDQAAKSIAQPVDATFGVASGVEDAETTTPLGSVAPPANPYEYEVWAA